jgi:phospholipase/carboxylesterase
VGVSDPRERLPQAAAGASVERARAAMILLHGRGATAQSILSLAEVFAQPEVAYVAPQAPGNAWYPLSFLAPIERNEPFLSASLGRVAAIVDALREIGFASARIMLLGFSQGGCLALEFAARNARRYGGVAGLSAGLIGPEGTPRVYPGSLSGTRIFLGCSNVDPHVPLWRVNESTKTLQALGGSVTERIYSGFGHAVNDDEIGEVRRQIADCLSSPAAAAHDAAPGGAGTS